ncbi:MAG: hypothetical protein WEB28_05505 [Nitrosopumilaceae archaeon]
MVNRVVATKLSEEEHTQLLDLCNTQGCTPSALIKEAIMQRLNPSSDTKKELSDNKPRYIGIIKK